MNCVYIAECDGGDGGYYAVGAFSSFDAAWAAAMEEDENSAAVSRFVIDTRAMAIRSSGGSTPRVSGRSLPSPPRSEKPNDMLALSGRDSRDKWLRKRRLAIDVERLSLHRVLQHRPAQLPDRILAQHQPVLDLLAELLERPQVTLQRRLGLPDLIL